MKTRKGPRHGKRNPKKPPTVMSIAKHKATVAMHNDAMQCKDKVIINNQARIDELSDKNVELYERFLKSKGAKEDLERRVQSDKKVIENYTQHRISDSHIIENLHTQVEELRNTIIHQAIQLAL